ncbi:stromelysin-1-like [Pholidichthys leucotaenia]
MHVMPLPCWALLVLIPGPWSTAPTFALEEDSTPPEPQADLKLATDYLQQYYKLQRDPLGRMKRSGPSFISKVKDMQIFFGLNVTGELDSNTLEVMQSPRCGVPDVEEYSNIHGTRWNKNVITYSIGRYTRDLPRSTVDSLIESAFRVWARASSLTFVRSPTRNADIMVDFVTYAHGDLYPFDGPRGTLAHAFGPGYGIGGDTHFDDAERWTARDAGFNLFVVAAHEFGHALGLKHSRNPESLMYPNYRASRPASLLSREDVANINALYRPARVNLNHIMRNFQRNPWLSGSLFPRLMQDKCSPDLTFDAVSTLGDATFFFRERYLWIKHNEKYDIKEGPISNFMPKIETSIDAAFYVPRRSTAYLIHESMFWTVKDSLVKGKPRALSHFGFPAWVQDVDAAVHIARTGRTLFFMHDIYWSYNENRRVMDLGYPQYISESFPGINSTINAAVHKDGFIYFFIGPRVYKYDYTQKRVVRDEKANSWLGCELHGYLRRFYGLNFRDKDHKASTRKVRSVSAMEQKIREMQNFFSLRETGKLDSHMLDVMREPRCGVPDVDNFSFYPHRPKWKSHTITYTIAKYTPDMKREDTEKSLRSALKMWSDAAPLKFIKVHHRKADIVFSFARKTHGDFFPFDGPRGVLAHAFQPGDGIGGDVHFDDDETWTAGRQGYSLFAVAAHELGHSLGLTHSRDPSAIMYPIYRQHSSTQYSLSKDDERGIQTLYGKPNQKVETKAASEKCDPSFTYDAATVIDNEIIFFKNRYMWMRTTKTTYWNHLKQSHSSTYLPGISSHVDAAYDIPAKGVAYIFSGHRYWVVQQLKIKSHSGSIYEYGFSTRVRQVDAAVHVSEYGKTFFFTGEYYYRYDENNRQMDRGFPRLIQWDWPRIPRRVDAAFKLHGSIFLLSGTKSYQYDFRKKQIVNVISGNSWLGC